MPGRGRRLFGVLLLLVVDEADQSHLCSVAAARTELVDLGVTAGAVFVLGSNLVEEFLHDVFLGDIGKSGAAAREGVLFPEIDSAKLSTSIKCGQKLLRH